VLGVATPKPDAEYYADGIQDVRHNAGGRSGNVGKMLVARSSFRTPRSKNRDISNSGVGR
jgi:hypothetical protein